MGIDPSMIFSSSSTYIVCAQARRFMRHDVVAPELFAQGEAGGDVVGMGVGRNGVNKGQTVLFKAFEVRIHVIVNRVHQSSLTRRLVDDEIGHGPNAFIELFKQH